MLAKSYGHGLGTVGGTDLCIETVDVFLHAFAADAKLLGYLLIAEATGQRMQDVRLTGRQLGRQPQLCPCGRKGLFLKTLFMMGWMVYGEIEVSVGLLPRRTARIISKRRRDATWKMFQNGEH